MRGPFHRRRFLVRPFQKRLIFFQGSYFAVLLLGIYFAFLEPLLAAVQDSTLSSAERTGSAWALVHFDRHVVPVLVPLILGLFLHSVLVSHRIAGPLYRFGVVLRALAAGDLSQRFRLRSRDYLHEEAEQLQQAIDALRTRLVAIRQEARSARAAAAALEGSSSGVAVREALTRLDSHLEELRLDPAEAAVRVETDRRAA